MKQVLKRFAARRRKPLAVTPRISEICTFLRLEESSSAHEVISIHILLFFTGFTLLLTYSFCLIILPTEDLALLVTVLFMLADNSNLSGHIFLIAARFYNVHKICLKRPRYFGESK